MKLRSPCGSTAPRATPVCFTSVFPSTCSAARIGISRRATKRLLTKLDGIRKNNAVAGGSVPATLLLLPPTAAPFQTFQSRPAHLDVARSAPLPPSEASPASASMDEQARSAPFPPSEARPASASMD
eukprot:4235643-Pleurochrysis_carterae.AAC.1